VKAESNLENSRRKTVAITGNFSRGQRTFDRLKHYVGVRLQQGVPIVDEDWNELEDIRREELRVFLKWFVGDGVPKGNSGFRIEPIENHLILTPAENGFDADGNVSVQKVRIEIDLENSTAAADLGFDIKNYYAERAAPPAPQLTSHEALPESMDFDPSTSTLVILVYVAGTLHRTHKVDFSIEGALLNREGIAEAIGKQTNDEVTAIIGQRDDFNIAGGDGTPEGVGRCLVNGWEVINECGIRYKAQPLAVQPDLATTWGVDALLSYAPPEVLPAEVSEETVLIYLDVWERVVKVEEDPDHLKHPDIGMETCIRIKREWVVRVTYGKSLEAPPEGHVFFELARFTWGIAM
jgi:hypothetical protein